MIRKVFIAGILTFLMSGALQSRTNSQSAQNDTEVTKAGTLAAEVAQLYNQGKFAEALPLAKRCLEIREKAFTPKDEQLRTALNNLAEVYMALKKFREARPLFERLIKSYEEFNPTDLRLAAALQRLALVYFIGGEHDRTEKLYQRATDLTITTSQPNDKKVADAAAYLAEYYQAVGDYKKAEPIYRYIISIREKQPFAGNSEGLQAALDRYACLLHKTRREDEARMLENRANPMPANAGLPISGTLVNGRAVSLPQPMYPEEARAARVSGTVKVRVIIDESGKVVRACAIEGPSLLMRASEGAAHKALFTPTKLGDQTVKVSGILTYNFVVR